MWISVFTPPPEGLTAGRRRKHVAHAQTQLLDDLCSWAAREAANRQGARLVDVDAQRRVVVIVGRAEGHPSPRAGLVRVAAVGIESREERLQGAGEISVLRRVWYTIHV